MITYFVSSAAGWIAVILAAFEIALPYWLRRVSPLQASAIHSSPYLPSMWPHYWLGYLLVALSLGHAFAVMETPLGRTNAEGIWAATGALVLLFLQLSLGLYLQTAVGRNRRLLKRCHFWGMLSFAGLLIWHIALNAA